MKAVVTSPIKGPPSRHDGRFTHSLAGFYVDHVWVAIGLRGVLTRKSSNARKSSSKKTENRLSCSSVEVYILVCIPTYALVSLI